MRPKVIGVIAIFAPMAMLFIYFEIRDTGLCFFGICDTEIEISDIIYPSQVKHLQSFETKFTVSNAGENTKQNCVLHFMLGSPGGYQILSEPFSISPDEKLNITLEFSGFKASLETGNSEKPMTAWIVCDGIESHRSFFKTFMDPRSILELWEDPFSDNP